MIILRDIDMNDIRSFLETKKSLIDALIPVTRWAQSVVDKAHASLYQVPAVRHGTSSCKFLY